MQDRSTQPSHAAGAPAPPGVGEPSYAERARTLAEQGGHSTLATMSRKHPGFPFASVMPYGLTDSGEPLLLISSMAMHTRNLLSDPRATLLIVQATEDRNPLGAGRLSIMGQVRMVTDAKETGVAERYLQHNPSAQSWLQYGDFQFFAMDIVDVYFVGGFGVMGWVSAEDYRNAQFDPLVHHAEGILTHMNQDHRDALVLLAGREISEPVRDATMTAVDRYGFHLRLELEDGFKGTRMAFPTTVASVDDVRETFMRMLDRVR